MCLAIPAKILSVDGTAAHCEMSGVTKDIDISLTPEAKAGRPERDKKGKLPQKEASLFYCIVRTKKNHHRLHRFTRIIFFRTTISHGNNNLCKSG